MAHPLSVKFMHVLRDPPLSFATGAELSSLPELRVAVARLSALSTNERHVERKHRMVGMGLVRSSNLGAASVSLIERLPEIKSGIAVDPYMFKTLVDLCDRVYRPADALKVLGFAQHPENPQRMDHSDLVGLGGGDHRLAKSIVYRLDLHVQHLDLDGRVHKRQGARRAAPRPTGGGGGPRDMCILDELIARAAVAAFNESVPIGSYFSLPRKPGLSTGAFSAVLAGADRNSIMTMVAPPKALVTDTVDDDFGIVADRSGAPQVDSPHVFFRLVTKQANLKKLVRSDTRAHFDLDQFVVTHHRVPEINHASSTVAIRMEPVDASEGIKLMRSEHLHEVLLWKTAPEAVEVKLDDGFTHGDLDACHRLLHRLGVAGAYVGSSVFLDLSEGLVHSAPDEAECANILLKEGWLEKDPQADDGDQLVVQLAMQALDRLQLCVRLVAPAKPLQKVLEWSPSWSAYECLRYLRQHGWRFSSAGNPIGANGSGVCFSFFCSGRRWLDLAKR